jgi:predicted nucleotidyltransferase
MKNEINRMIIYKVESGSYLYGTYTESSDKDYTSIFIPTTYELLSLNKCDFIDNSTKNSSEGRKNTNEDIDDKQYALSNYLKLLLNGNPNLTEILFSKYPIIEMDSFKIFKDNVDKLISRNIYNSFKGFAVSQKKKLQYKSERFDQLEKAIFYLENEYSKDINDPTAKMSIKLASWLNKYLTEYKGDKRNVKSFHENLPIKTIYEKIKSEYNNYGCRTRTDTFNYLRYDVKYASHTIRLFHEGERLLSTGKLEYPITGKAYDDIMAVKNGELSIIEFNKLCDYYDSLAEKAFESTSLPEKPDWDWVNNTLVKILKSFIRAEDIVKSSKILNKE